MGNERDTTRSMNLKDPRVIESIDRYWKQNVMVMSLLLAVWAFVGLGCGVLFADSLNRFNLGGFPLGFWFAQQGSIAAFVVLILIYALILNRLDALHLRELDQIRSAPAGTPDA